MGHFDNEKMIGGIFPTYQAYIDSELWWDKRDVFLSNHKCCEICGTEKKRFEWHYKRVKLKNSRKKVWCTVKVWFGKHLYAHHKTYENVCNERTKDLMAVCLDCHKKIHKKWK